MLVYQRVYDYPHIGEPLSRPRFPVRTNLAVEHPNCDDKISQNINFFLHFPIQKASIFGISHWHGLIIGGSPTKPPESGAPQGIRSPATPWSAPTARRGDLHFLETGTPQFLVNCTGMYRENIENGWFTSGFFRVPYFKTNPIEELGYQRKGIVNSIVLGLFDFVLDCLKLYLEVHPSYQPGMDIFHQFLD